MNFKTNFQIVSTINNLYLKITDSGYVKMGTDWSGKSVNAPYSRLYYITKGEGQVKYNGGEFKLKAGYVYLLPRAFEFEFFCTDKMEQLYFHVNYLNNNGYDILLNITTPVEFEMKISKMKEIVKMYAGENLTYAVLLKNEIENSVTTIISKLDSEKFLNVYYSDYIGKTIKYINKNLSLRLTGKMLADRCFISEFTLAKHFKKEVGITLGKYIDELVIFKAEHLLMKSYMSIKEISNTLGFCDQFYFSRRFKEKFNITPSEYRKITTKIR